MPRTDPKMVAWANEERKIANIIEKIILRAMKLLLWG